MKKHSSDRKFIQAERVFLHEIASPLMLAHGWLERWVKRSAQVQNEEEFKSAMKQLDRLKQLIEQRREQLSQLEKDFE